MPDSLSKYSYYLGSVVNLLGGFSNPLMLVRVFLNMAPRGVKRFQMRHSGLVFSVRGAMDLWSIKEALIDRFYERFGTPISDGWTVVDIGGGIGEFTIFAAHGHPANKVYAFEPFPESFALLQENLQQNGITNVQSLPEAVSDHTGKIQLDISNKEPLQIQSHPVHEPSKSISVPSVSIQEAFTRLEISHCDLLKLDCEGAEYAILLNAPGELLKRIRRIVMEYHDQITDHNHNDLVNNLSANGFKVQVQPNFVHDNIGYLYAFQP